jgi:putative peptidoglycan lipid II flippase
VFRDTLRLQGVCLGVLAGAFMMVIVQLPALYKRGLRNYSFCLDVRHPSVIQYWKLFFPVMLGMSLTQINLLIMPTFFGSIVGEGAITALNYANRMMFIPLGLFGSVISMAIFPTISRQANAGEFDLMRRTLVRGIRATMIFSLPCTAFMLTCGLASVRLVFGYGRFTYADCRATAFALSFYSFGLIGHTANQAINRGFYARKDSITPVLAGLIGLGITVPLSLVLIRTPLKHGGVALAISLATIVNMVILLIKARTKLSLELSGIISMFFKTLAASAAMGAAAWWAGSLFHIGPDNWGFKAVLMSFIAMVAASAVVFTAAAKLLRIEEFDEIAAMLLGRLGIKKAKT